MDISTLLSKLISVGQGDVKRSRETALQRADSVDCGLPFARERIAKELAYK